MPDYKAVYTYYCGKFNGSHLVPEARTKTYEFAAPSLQDAKGIAEAHMQEIRSDFLREATLDNLVEM